MFMEIKWYESPELEVIELMSEQYIFAASTELEDPDNSEEEEGWE